MLAAIGPGQRGHPGVAEAEAEDPQAGLLLWSGPYSADGRGLLSTHLDPAACDECLTHLVALEALRHRPVAQHRGDIARRFKAHYGLSATTYRARFAHDAARLHAKKLAAG